MSDMLQTLTDLVRTQDRLRADVQARDALLVALLVKFGKHDAVRVSKADYNKAQQYGLSIKQQKTGLKVQLQKLEEPTSK